MRLPHPIPYQGSKRGIAQYILPFVPPQTATLIEPFAGSAAVSIAAASAGKAACFHLNDINWPLMTLWHEIVNDPRSIAEAYENLWNEQYGKGREYYDQVRAEFNRTHKPAYLLYLLARCVKAAIRYNPRGEFNQSPDNRRLGRRPTNMSNDIYAVSKLFKGRTIITSGDYRDTLSLATKRDLVYMDPPYQGVSNGRDQRYYRGVQFSEFVTALSELNRQGIAFILSYDGRTGNKSFGAELPSELELTRFEVDAGPSSQATLLGAKDRTFESIYISPAVAARIESFPTRLSAVIEKE